MPSGTSFQPADMEAAITEARRDRVSDDDIVWAQGEVGSLDPLRNLPGTKHLVLGNEDRPKGVFKDLRRC